MGVKKGHLSIRTKMGLTTVIATSLLLSSCTSPAQDKVEVTAPNQDNILDVMQEYLTEEDIAEIEKGYKRYLSLIDENRYEGVKGILKAYLDISNQYDYNQQKLKFADYYASLTREEKNSLFSSYSTKEKFNYYFYGSKYNAYLDNTTVCLGFTDLLEDYLIRKGYDVQSVIADGYTMSNEERVNIPKHKFLKVLLDGKWYYINPSSDYDGNIDSFRFILTSKKELERHFRELGNIYEWQDDEDSKAIKVYPRRKLIKAFLDIRDNEISRERGLYINIDGAIKSYILEKEKMITVGEKEYLVVDNDFFDILKRTEIFSQFKNLYMDLYSPKIPYRVYEKVFSSFQSADILFSEKMRKEEVQKIQKAYLKTRNVGKKTRVAYPYPMEGLTKEEDIALKTLLSCDLYKPLEEGKVKFMKHIQINMSDSRVADFKEYFKYLDKLESLDFIYINNESSVDIFQIPALRDSGLPIYYSCERDDIEYGYIKNKVYLKPTNPSFVNLAKSLQGKGNIVVINNYQKSEDIAYIDEYKTTSLENSITQKELLIIEAEKLESFVKQLCEEKVNDKATSTRESALDIYNKINEEIDRYLNINISFKRTYYMAEAFEDISEEGYMRYKNNIINSIIDDIYMRHNIKIFRNDDIMNMTRDNDGRITIALKNRHRENFEKNKANKVLTEWNNESTKYIFDSGAMDRFKRELEQRDIVD